MKKICLAHVIGKKKEKKKEKKTKNPEPSLLRSTNVKGGASTKNEKNEHSENYLYGILSKELKNNYNNWT